MGASVSQNDDTDAPNDGQDCTDDACVEGSPKHTPKPPRTQCSQNGGSVCAGDGTCVECVSADDCTNEVCEDFHCVPASCGDTMKNGSETDIDCGGGVCPDCDNGKSCLLPSDCISGACSGNTCAPSCTDMLQNNGESDVDCGGVNCAPCGFGDMCVVPSDCVTASCVGGLCTCPGTCACDRLVISEIRSRGAAGAADEFIELYNPTAAAVTLDNQWKLEGRSASGASYTTKWTGAGVVIPSKGHVLIVGTGYAQSPAADAALSAGITDAASVRLLYMGATVDSVCYYYNTSTLTSLQGAGFTCEGTPVTNLPHNDGTSIASNSDASIERKPGGALGNCTDAGDSATDFSNIAPAAPQNAASAPTP
jgi:hypothetical protein